MKRPLIAEHLKVWQDKTWVPVKHPGRSCYKGKHYSSSTIQTVLTSSHSGISYYSRKWKWFHHFSMIDGVHRSKKTNLRLDPALSTIGTAQTSSEQLTGKSCIWKTNITLLKPLSHLIHTFISRWKGRGSKSGSVQMSVQYARVHRSLCSFKIHPEPSWSSLFMPSGAETAQNTSLLPKELFIR